MNHFLTLSIASALTLLAITQAHASSHQHHSTPAFKQGYYVGGAFGAGFGHADWKGTSSISAANDNNQAQFLVDTWTPEGDTSDTVPAGRIMFGYEFVYRPLYLAFELGGTFSGPYEFNYKESRNYGPYEYSGQVLAASADINDSVTLGGSEFNIDMRPGWLITANTLLYARLGVAVNSLDIKSSGTWTEVSNNRSPAVPVIASDTSKYDQTVAGIRIGAGIEYLFSKHFGVTLDYIYTDYGDITTRSDSSNDYFFDYEHVAGEDAPVVTVSTQTIMLGLDYHW